MKFKKYQHIERWGTDEVDGIEYGECYIFYKIDGSNRSAWLNNEENIKAGSRNRELTLEKDNQGFYEYILSNNNIKTYLEKHPRHRLYGEWLIPHSLKTYRQDAWRRFYIFDVCLDKDDETVEYLSYDIYKPLLEEYNLDYIPPLATIKNPTYESLIRLLDKTGQFLVEDGKGNGEGIVIKNYDFYNKYHRQTWAKIVANEFKEKNHKTMGCPNISAKTIIEEKIIKDFCTESFIEKEYSKIINEKNGWKSQYIPMLFGRVYHELVKEEIWNIIKKYKKPKIDFKTLNALVIRKIKEVKKEVFN
ncbi:MAG: RNA ligase family protein [bacterium]